MDQATPSDADLEQRALQDSAFPVVRIRGLKAGKHSILYSNFGSSSRNVLSARKLCLEHMSDTRPLRVGTVQQLYVRDSDIKLSITQHVKAIHVFGSCLNVWGRLHTLIFGSWDYQTHSHYGSRVRVLDTQHLSDICIFGTRTPAVVYLPRPNPDTRITVKALAFDAPATLIWSGIRLPENITGCGPLCLILSPALRCSTPERRNIKQWITRTAQNSPGLNLTVSFQSYTLGASR